MLAEWMVSVVLIGIEDDPVCWVRGHRDGFPWAVHEQDKGARYTFEAAQMVAASIRPEYQPEVVQL